MTIQYKTKAPLRPLQYPAADVIREANEQFKNSEMTVVGEGFSHIFSNATLHESYVEMLMNGIDDPDMAAMFKQLGENAVQTVTESTYASGITPISSLNLPILRVLLPRLCMIKTLRNRPIQTPNFTLSTMVNYLVDAQGNKYRMPGGTQRVPGGIGRKRIDKDVVLTADKPMAKVQLFEDIAASKSARDYIDNDCACLVSYKNAKGEKISSEIVDFDTSARTATIPVVMNEDSVNVTILSRVDTHTGDLLVSMVNEDTVPADGFTFSFQGFLSNENNLRATEVMIEMENQEILIGSGDNIVAPLTFQTLTDLKAMYNIDGAIQLSDQLSRAMAEKLDFEVINFYDNMHQRNSASLSKFKAYYDKFDCNPRPNWRGNPTDWRDLLKRNLDQMLTDMIEETHIQNGRFVISGRPQTTKLINNSNWINVGQNNVSTVGGVTVDYYVGNYVSAAGLVEIVASVNLPKDRLFITYIPNDETYATYDYFAYSYTIINDNSYLNPNQPNVPGILLNRRDKFATVVPVIGVIDVLNNNTEWKWQETNA